jgi:2'-hydroxyisoflavone reductase
VQVLDVRDLATWLVDAVAADVTGPVNLVGEQVRFADLLALAADVSGFTSELVAAEADWLLERGVNPWGGPRSLPLWLLPGEEGAVSFRADRAMELGLQRRPLRETPVDVLEDEQDRGLDRVRRAGRRRDEETALLGEMS